MPILIGDLYKTTQRLEAIFVGRPFTPDGHLVGSIGEVVAQYIYDLKLTTPSFEQCDATTNDGRTVQIKLTGRKGKAFGFRWANSRPCAPPDLLIALKLTEAGFVEIYNGKFPRALLEGRRDSSNGQLSITIAKLRELNPGDLPERNSFKEFNKLFVQEVKSE